LEAVLPRPKSLKPSYCCDKSSNRAFVTLNGRRKYLGPPGSYNSQPTRDTYDRIVGEWIARGRAPDAAGSTQAGGGGPTVSILIAAFWTHAQSYYKGPSGKPTSEVAIFRRILRPLRRLYGAMPAVEFRQAQLKGVREEMIKPGWSRRSINKCIGRVRLVFKWGGENMGLTGAVYQDLRTVSPLKRGRTDARETDAVKPVPEHVLAATLPNLSRHVRAMVDLQLLTGARPGEIVRMRTCDINRGGKVWIYKPFEHKTQHHGHDREIRIGPKAQKILAPFLKLDLQAFIFSPAEAEAERLAALHAKRLRSGTPIEQGNAPGTNRAKVRRHPPGARYTVDSYRKAIARACEAAFEMPAELLEPRGKKARKAEAELADDVRKARKQERQAKRSEWRELHVWHPHQLRHNAGTLLRRQYGVEAARLILGHQSVDVTELYAEVDTAKAEAIMAEVG
jgi:integrase